MPNRSRSFLAANGFVVLTLGVGLLNNILIAVMFGLTERVDAFFAATVLPTMFMIICVDYLGKNFLPVLAVARKEGDDTASELTSNIVLVVFVLASAVAALLLVFSQPLFALLLPGFDEEDLVLVARYFAIMAPAIAFMAATTFHEYVCQYDERYATVVLIKMALPLVNLAALLMLAPRLGEYCLPIGYAAGHIVVFALMTGFARYRFRPRLAFRGHLEKKIFTNSAIVMSTGLFARSKSLFVNYFASLLGGGVITAIALATKVTEPAQRTAFYAARMVMFSRTARMFQGGEIAALVRLYEFGVKASFLILAPILWWVGLHAHAIVDLAFGHGAIAAREVRLVGSVLIALIPSVLFLGVNQLLSNAFYAMDRIKIPALIMPAGTLLYAAAAGPASAAFGAPGLTLTTTLVSVVLFLLLLSLLARALPGLRAGRTLLRVAGYCAWSGVCLVGCTWIVQAAWPDALVAAVVSLPAGIALYGGMLLLLRDRTLLRILETGREIFSRRVTA